LAQRRIRTLSSVPNDAWRKYAMVRFTNEEGATCAVDSQEQKKRNSLEHKEIRLCRDRASALSATVCMRRGVVNQDRSSLGTDRQLRHVHGATVDESVAPTKPMRSPRRRRAQWPPALPSEEQGSTQDVTTSPKVGRGNSRKVRHMAWSLCRVVCPGGGQKVSIQVSWSRRWTL